MSSAKPLWQLHGVSYRHPSADVDAVADVTLSIAAGRMTALLGPNGAGKSTLFQLLLGTLRPREGTVTFEGRPLHLWSRRDLAIEVGAVPQGEAEPLFSVREIVAMGRYPRLGPWQREHAEDVVAIDAAMERCDVKPFAQRWISTLSGGERQRVRLARALAQEPSVLALDEPTTFLDIRHEMTTFELLRRLRDEGVGILLVTHNLNLAARYADELVLMDRGRVVAHGSPRDVLTKERVDAVYEWPVSIVPDATGAPQVMPLSGVLR
jgi:iron complex transport system ATP-binding protein